ncbi:MAG: hypothetical protein WCT05_08525, partial [Lentisphaeria bacterium]
ITPERLSVDRNPEPLKTVVYLLPEPSGNFSAEKQFPAIIPAVYQHKHNACIHRRTFMHFGNNRKQFSFSKNNSLTDKACNQFLYKLDKSL